MKTTLQYKKSRSVPLQSTESFPAGSGLRRKITRLGACSTRVLGYKHVTGQLSNENNQIKGNLNY